MSGDDDRVDVWVRPLHWFVRDQGSGVAHLLDYECATADHALCGRPFGEIRWQGDERPRAVCRRCQERLSKHEAGEWQRRAEAEAARRREQEAELQAIRSRLRRAERTILDLEAASTAFDPEVIVLHWYVRDRGSRSAHHLDSEREALDHGLCGRPFDEILWQGAERPRAVCRACQAHLEAYEKRWWQRVAAAEHARRTALEEAQSRSDEQRRSLEQKIENQRLALKGFNERVRSAKPSNLKPPRPTPSSGKRSKRSLAHDLPRLTKQTRSRTSESWLPEGYKLPTIRVVPGGLPGHGKGR